MGKIKVIAITGPSGAGKTTLGDALIEEYGYIVPRHTTTRAQRPDDKLNFYRYISVEDFLHYQAKEKFVISSYDGIRGYGVLKKDCEDAHSIDEEMPLLIYISYKDIEQIISLDEDEYEVSIIALTFKELEKGMLSRIEGDETRKHTPEDINYRIESAQTDHARYEDALKKYAKAIIYTDKLDKRETLNMAKKALGIGGRE